MSSGVDEDDNEPVAFTAEQDSNFTLVRNVAVETEEIYQSPNKPDDAVPVEPNIIAKDVSNPDSTLLPTPPNDNQPKPAKPNIEIKPSDFLFGTTLGEGSFARVVHCRLKSMQKDYAMKILEKSFIKKEKKVNSVLMEKDILIRYSHPMIIKLYYCFTDTQYIYMCMDLAPGGELGKVISKAKHANLEKGIFGKACDVRTCQFYTGEIVEALEYLHANNIVHRDLKPENILLTANGHIKLGDFGAALLGEDKERSFDGTALYVSPEVLNSGPATKSSDLWAAGCILYQMLTGETPFAGETEYLIFRNIQTYVEGSHAVKWSDGISDNARSLAMALLHPDPTKRIGGGTDDPDNSDNSNGYGILKGHPFFDGIPWGELLHTTAPYQPNPADFPNPNALSDGADDDWMFGGEATVISTQSRKKSSDRAPVPSKKASADAEGEAQGWKVFLQPNENQLFTGLASKRKGLFSKQRRLVLTDLPRLFYVDPDSLEMKGEVPWEAAHPVRCTIIDNHKFDVLATKTNRVYHLLDKEVGSQVWVDLINAMVEKQATEKAKKR